jgi:hypothetical protein
MMEVRWADANQVCHRSQDGMGMFLLPVSERLPLAELLRDGPIVAQRRANCLSLRHGGSRGRCDGNATHTEPS